MKYNVIDDVLYWKKYMNSANQMLFYYIMKRNFDIGFWNNFEMS